MFDCTTNNYEALYAPWLKNPGQLLDLAKWNPGEKLLDLAGGTGTVAKEAYRRIPTERLKEIGDGNDGAIHLFDLKPRCRNIPIGLHTGRAEYVENHFLAETFDVIVCRQAIGYINMIEAIPGIHRILKLGGRFAFNSFVKPPRTGIRIRRVDGAVFLEAHVTLFRHVFHLQMRLSSKPGIDFSVFTWHDTKTLYELLRPWFAIELHAAGPSLRWVCTKESR